MSVWYTLVFLKVKRMLSDSTTGNIHVYTLECPVAGITPNPLEIHFVNNPYSQILAQVLST